MKTRYLTDVEIMALPNWSEALNEMIVVHKQDIGREPLEVHIGSFVEILLKRFRALGHLRELFLKLQGETARTFCALAEATLAFDNSSLDPLLRIILDHKEAEYQFAFNKFQFHFPYHTV
jgi:hypothetical protein